MFPFGYFSHWDRFLTCVSSDPAFVGGDYERV